MNFGLETFDSIEKNANTTACGRVYEGLSERAVIPSNYYIDAAIGKAERVLSAPKQKKITVMDDLLGFMLDQFAGKPSVHEIAIVTTERTNVPEPIDPVAIPVMIVAELLSGQRLKIDVAKCSNWVPFVERYGAAMMAA